MPRPSLRVVLAIVVASCAISIAWAMLRPQRRTPLPQLTLEVLNGSGVDRLGARWADSLRARGQDVVRVGDAGGNDHERTMLIDRRGHRRSSERLAAELGVPLVLEAREGSDVDATLLLGADHRRFGPSPP